MRTTQPTGSAVLLARFDPAAAPSSVTRRTRWVTTGQSVVRESAGTCSPVDGEVQSVIGGCAAAEARRSWR